MIILGILVFILFVLVLWLIGYVIKITQAIEAQNHLNETLGNCIVKNKQEIYVIKNSIYQ